MAQQLIALAELGVGAAHVNADGDDLFDLVDVGRGWAQVQLLVQRVRWGLELAGEGSGRGGERIGLAEAISGPHRWVTAI